MAAAWGEGYQDVGLVFSREDGSPIRPTWLSERFKRLATAAGLPLLGARPLHALRHTWATLALQPGVPTKVVSEQLGHANISITADNYQHVTAGMQRDAAEQVAALIHG